MLIIGFLVLVGCAVLLTVLQQKGKLSYWPAVGLWCVWGLALLIMLVILLNYFGVWDVGFYPHHGRVYVQ